MFHLLTRFAGWGDHSGTVMTSRVYINKDNPVVGHLVEQDAPVLDQVRRYPALLVQEPQVANPEPARVVYIANIQKVGKEYRIEYYPAPGVDPIPSNLAVELLKEAGQTEMSLNHSCWRVVDTDLFRLLLANAQRFRMEPTVFNFDAYYRPNPDLVSVMMPFDAGFKPVYDAIRSGVQEAGFECQRADDIWINQHIIQDVVDLISSANTVICDLTGKNPNVFYEAGIAHSLGKQIIMITQSHEDVPFDLKHLRYLHYLKNGEGLEALQGDIHDRLASLNGI